MKCKYRHEAEPLKSISLEIVTKLFLRLSPPVNQKLGHYMLYCSKIAAIQWPLEKKMEERLSTPTKPMF